jgi:hypothetical protein
MTEIIKAASIPASVEETRPQPDERTRYQAEYAIERARQIEWRMQARRYAGQMLRSEQVRDSGSPCQRGTSDWLTRLGVPALVAMGTGQPLGAGREEEARISAERSLLGITAVSFSRLPAHQMLEQLTAFRVHGARWREAFIHNLRHQEATYEDMPLNLIEELIAFLNAPAVPATESDFAAVAQGAPFPAIASPVPVPAPPQTARMNVMVMLELELDGAIAAMPEADLEAQAAERIRGTLQRSTFIRSTPGVRLSSAGVSVLPRVTRS